MSHRWGAPSGPSRGRAVGTTVGDAVVRHGGTTAAAAAQRAGLALQRAGTALEHSSTAAAPVAASAVGTAAETVETVLGTAAGAVGGTVGGLVEVVGGLLEEPAVRGGAALDALRGRRVTPPVAARRWPWALLAAAGGAAAGAGLALVVRRLQHRDPPGAQEPHELRAVVDLPAEAPTDPVPAATPPGTG